MGAALWIPLISAILGCGGGLIGSLVLRPKLRAEARNINAHASRTEWQTLRDEIARLDREVKALRGERADAEREKKQMRADAEREKKQLRGLIRRLSKRVSDLETILKIHPITPEMQAALDELDRKTGRHKGTER